VDHQTGQAADEGSVDADELQIAAHVQLDALGGLLAVPTVNSLRDDLGDLMAIGALKETAGALALEIARPLACVAD
jgi:hypothetical protein